ncbi:MAG: glycosyl hydrolase [Mucilaginibacter sp.]|nr:glycosyl hydrolase [Mucilaginibacter sp.]
MNIFKIPNCQKLKLIPHRASTIFTGLTLLLALFAGSVACANNVPYVSATKTTGSFTLSAAGKSAPLYISNDEYEGVMIALKSFQADVKAVTGAEPVLSTGKAAGKEVVIIGTIGKSTLIDKLIQDKKINVAGVAGKWEVFISQVVKNPMPGIESALVIAGSDKRGTIFGIYDLSSQIGVSPWYWWADVPIKHQTNLYVSAGRHSDGEPAVKYRGIFINDEGPSFLGWAREKFPHVGQYDNGVNHLLYAHMFELLLRLKANFLWPAMWSNAFNDDDPENPILADKMGIVMGTSHHEPMDRAQKEWARYNKNLTQPQKAWNYATNGEVLKEYWRKGVERNGDKEVLTTIGMRGDGDAPMAPGGPKANMSLLEKIVKDQRDAITEATHKEPGKTPQVWALYKEVQDYYDAGMRVPGDVELLYCDDNWGNVRRLPDLKEPKNPGGYGLYYHFDYHGGPRNYQWVNSNPLPHTWEQMHLAYEYGVKQEWIVNVGDLKTLEFPISFFLDYAWNPDKYPANSLEKYTKDWVAQQFGPEHASEIAYILSTYAKYNGRRKPELVNPTTIKTSTPYSLTDYREFETVVADFNKLKDQAEKLSKKMPAQYKDAFYELVLHPVIASANYNEMYLAATKNQWYGEQGRTSANDEAQKADKLFARDAQISKYYNDTLANGKWQHMMDEIHIGYISWTEPKGGNKLPEAIKVDAPVSADMGVSAEGSATWWPKEQSEAVLPELTKYPNTARYIEVFNRGQAPFNYTVETGAPYVKVSSNAGKIDKQERLWVSVDWAKAPKGTKNIPITITGPNGTKVIIQATVNNSKPVPTSGFVLSNGYASMEAIHYSKMVNGPNVKWAILPDRGRTLSAIEATPITSPRQEPGGNSPHLEYEVNISDTGTVKIRTFVAPSIDFTHEKGLWYAMSIDNETPQKVNIDSLIEDTRKANSVMEAASANEIKELISTHHITQPGKHIVKYWLVDPAVVLEKIVVDMGGVKPSYLGPPESYRVVNAAKK